MIAFIMIIIILFLIISLLIYQLKKKDEEINHLRTDLSITEDELTSVREAGQDYYEYADAVYPVVDNMLDDEEVKEMEEDLKSDYHLFYPQEESSNARS